jgi:hypothetical protein
VSNWLETKLLRMFYKKDHIKICKLYLIMQKWAIKLQSFVFKIIQNVYEENVEILCDILFLIETTKIEKC